MGPITLFDKSFLQALSVDESVWFDHFFLTNVVPIFFVETLADLEKEIPSGRTPEQEVSLIAAKTPEKNSLSNVFHAQICIANLQGHPFPMDGRPVVRGGKPVRTSERSGLVYDVAPEAQAYSRWQSGQYMEVEKRFAKNWRDMISSMSLEDIIKGLNSIGLKQVKVKTIEEAKRIAELLVNGSDHPFERMKLACAILGIPSPLFHSILDRWRSCGYPPLSAYAPYTAYVVMVELFFNIAAAANLFRVKDKTDLAYLFYLPFCMMFVSSDRFHKRCAPLFLRDDQEFVWGHDLKVDLGKINQHFDRLPQSDKEKGLFAIAPRPPSSGDFLVSRLWDRFLQGWRTRKIGRVPSPSLQKESNDKLVKQINEFTEAEPLKPDQIDFDLFNPKSVVISHMVSKRKGKWWQLPKDLPEPEGKS